MRVEPLGKDVAMHRDVNLAALAGAAVLTAEGQCEAVDVGDPSLRVHDDLGGVERLVGGHCRHDTAAAADTLCQDPDAVFAHRRDVGSAHADSAAVSGTAAIATDADREAFQRAADD